MLRLILVPQYPTKLRYQEWWWTEFPKHFANYYDEVIVLGKATNILPSFSSEFAPTKMAIEFETQQIDEYIALPLQRGDTLLLNDLSYPGLFANVLFHKRPDKCFAICHATSKNAYDYFEGDREIKYPIEKAIAKIFDKVFVATEYHKKKLGWPNIHTITLPFPPFPGKEGIKQYNIVSVARPGKQKHNAHLERLVEKAFNCTIYKCTANTWEEYYDFLSKSTILLITSKEETFGYQVIDAIKNGCIPVAPNKFSYPELISINYLYNNYIELIELIDTILCMGVPIPRLQVYDTFYGKITYMMQNE